jgi:hypothetical protein
LAAPEVDVGRCEIAEAFVIPAVIVVADEVIDLGFQVAGQIVKHVAFNAIQDSQIS